MKKRVVDLEPAEINRLATEAWATAAQEALRAGHSVTGSRDGRRFRYHPDGRVEDLGPVTQLTENDDLEKAEFGRSVA